jgi:predicted house-cleaning NTP pyrophosphatase (Maf/HAM1 superfamily)
MLFYNPNPTIMNHTDNIIFKNTKLTNTYSKRNRNIIDESMLTTIDRENHRNLQIEKYNNKKITPITSVSNAHNVSYLNSNLYVGKAGAYGIQEWIGCVAVSGMVGSYYNVMGLPIFKLYQELKEIL